MGAFLANLVKIAETVADGTSGTVSFQGVPATFRDLLLVIRGRGTNASTSIGVAVRFNSDTGTNYDDQRLSGANATVSSSATTGATSGTIGSLPGSTGLANDAGSIEAVIQDYRGTTFFKQILGLLNAYRTDGTAAGHVAQNRAAWWRSTAAINRVDVLASAGNFATGSVISLYGRN